MGKVLASAEPVDGVFGAPLPEVVDVLNALLTRFPAIRMLGDWRVSDTNAVSEVAHLHVSLR